MMYHPTPLTCAHCGAEIVSRPDGRSWAHILRHPEGASYLNRCQSPDVPYGMEAHPRGVPCPDWCLGAHVPQSLGSGREA